MTHAVGIFVFNDVEVLDFAGPYEVFTTASRMHSRAHPDAESLFNVFTIGQSKSSLRARAGLSVLPDYEFETHPSLDVFIVPGGVVTAELEKTGVIRWIEKTASQSKLTASVCTGAFLLAKAQLLDGKSVTTHWEDIDDLKSMFPTLRVKSNCRWVDEGKIVTSAGISAGIDMCLHLVERLAKRELAERTARQLDFAWTENR